MVRFAVHRSPETAPRHRNTSVAALAVTLLMVLSSCAALGETLSRFAQDDQGTKDKVVGWSLFHAAADQWQVASALTKQGAPWMHQISLVEQLRPGAKAPLYQGELPINTIIAPATPTDVGLGGEYGWRTAPDLGIQELHNGADIAAAEGSDVKSAMEGVVRAVFWDIWGGNRVEVAHTGDMVSTYNHLEKVLVEQGDRLEASQQLGTVGQTGSRVTGPHLHFETWVDGEAVDPQSFDWIDGDDVIPAPRDHARNPPVIERRGPGDRSSLKPGHESCPHAEGDPISCRAADPPTPTESCETRWTPDCGDPERPPALELCQDLLYGQYNCPPLEVYPGPEDCHPAPAEVGARTDCPPVEWPVLSSEACVSTAPGIFDCEPLAPVPGTAPGAEDCPPVPVEGARTDCPTAPPTLTDPLQCRTADQQAYDCVPFAPNVGLQPGAEDCPAALVEGARTDCPTPPEEPSEPNDSTFTPPVDGEVSPAPGAGATLLERRRQPTPGPWRSVPHPRRRPQ